MENKDISMEKQEKKQEDTEIEQQDQESTTPLDEQSDNSEAMIENLSEKIEILQDKLLRQMAESENIRTQSTKLVDTAREYAIFGFTKDLIPVMDNLSRALDHLPETLEGDIKNIVDGVRMTKTELESVFERHLLKPINPKAGDKFDYHIHNAIAQIETKEHKPGVVVNTMQAGYKIKDRLIRAASVTVAKSS